MPDTFTLISIDPGGNTGIAVFEIDTVTLEIVDIITSIVQLNHVVNVHDNLPLSRIDVLRRICNNLTDAYQPLVLAVEGVFLNARMPNAVLSLSQYVATIEQSFYANNRFIKLFKYQPAYVKKYIGSGGRANKDGMRVTVEGISELSALVDLNRVTEHEIDALAIGYLAIGEIRRYPHILISH